MVPEITVYKLDANGRVVWQYPATVLDRRPHAVRLEAAFNRDRVDLGYAVFRRGDRFVEHFYSDRWYNVFAVYDGSGPAFKGWYCNVCRPAELTETAVRCVDLALDLWAPPTGPPLVLDEDEFEALDLSAAERRNGREALQTLLHLAAANQLPT